MLNRDELLGLVAALSDEQAAALLDLLRAGALRPGEGSCIRPGDAAFSDWLLPEEDEAWRHLQQVP